MYYIKTETFSEKQNLTFNQKKHSLYPYIPDNIKKVERVNFFGTEIVLIENIDIPENEIHFVDKNNNCVGKIINVSV